MSVKFTNSHSIKCKKHDKQNFVLNSIHFCNKIIIIFFKACDKVYTHKYENIGISIIKKKNDVSKVFGNNDFAGTCGAINAFETPRLF